MGLFDSLLGGRPKTSKTKVAGLAASCLDYVLNDVGIDALIAGSLVLDRTFNVSFRSGKHKTGGDILAAVSLGELDEADAFKTFAEVGITDAFMLQPFIDGLVYAAVHRFESQSPAFAALSTT